MLLGIISDSHDNLINIKTALEYFNQQKIKHVFHAGDVCFSEALEFILKNYKNNLYLISGNGDDDFENFVKLEKKYKKLKLFSDFGKVIIAKNKIGFCHKQNLADQKAVTGEYDLLIYGHTHKPWEKIIKTNNKRVHLLNPGTLAGMFAKATFAVYDTKSCQAKLIVLEQLAKQYASKNKLKKT